MRKPSSAPAHPALLSEGFMDVLIADDDCISVDLLANSLEEFGYAVTTASNGREAFDLIRTGRFRLVISDWEMPEMSGVELCREIRRRRSSGYIYVIMLTCYSGVESVVASLDAGADDFLTKPFQPQELRVRLRAAQRILALESRDLTIFALAKLAESRDVETGAHLERIREYCRVLAEDLSNQERFSSEIDGEFVSLLYLTSPLHDIGKVGIPDAVLLKPGRLTESEFEIMKQHTIIGGTTLDSLTAAHPDAGFLAMARDIALTHHEQYDGGGYPCGLSGDEIPLCGRITSLADVYDALTTRRVYKPRYSHQVARDLILEGSGSHFDPAIVDSFLRCEDTFLAIHERFLDGLCDSAVDEPQQMWQMLTAAPT
jgi:putative two-component system response regulator